MFSVAQNALLDHPELKHVVLMEHAPRHDTPEVDPTGLKSELANYANLSLANLWHNSAMKDKITIGKHSLNTKRTNTVYKDDRTGRYDGVHYYSSYGKEIFTRSVSGIIKSVLTGTSSASQPTQSSSSQYKHRQHTKVGANYQQEYSVPLRNRFNVLGN